MLNDVVITSADTMDGRTLLIEMSDGTTLEFSLEQILTLTPTAILCKPETGGLSDNN